MSAENGPEIVIVGAGPVGLSLGLWLARRGRRALILEKNDNTSTHSRAPAIWPATQEILAELGVIETFLGEGIAVPRLQLHDADRETTLFTAPLEELAGVTRFPQLLVLPQSRTEALLRDALDKQPSVDIRWGCEAADLAESNGSVTVTYERKGVGGKASVSARLVVGCDGARSAVREKIGAELQGETYAAQAALADVEAPGTQDLPFPRLTTDPSIAIAIRMGETLWRLILPFAPEESVPLDQRIERAVARLLQRPYSLVWKSEFKLHRRLSSTFAKGRIVLAGDAAHLNSPVGGQGMNAGIKDAALLGPAIIATLDGDSRQPLRDYAVHRREAIEQGVNRFTNRLTRLLLWRRGRMIPGVLTTANAMMRVPPLRRRILRRMAMLDEAKR